MLNDTPKIAAPPGQGFVPNFVTAGLGRIVGAWVLTLPAAGLLGAFIVTWLPRLVGLS